MKIDKALKQAGFNEALNLLEISKINRGYIKTLIENKPFSLCYKIQKNTYEVNIVLQKKEARSFNVLEFIRTLYNNKEQRLHTKFVAERTTEGEARVYTFHITIFE